MVLRPVSCSQFTQDTRGFPSLLLCIFRGRADNLNSFKRAGFQTHRSLRRYSIYPVLELLRQSRKERLREAASGMESRTESARAGIYADRRDVIEYECAELRQQQCVPDAGVIRTAVSCRAFALRSNI
jgi:hypothetical protein